MYLVQKTVSLSIFGKFINACEMEGNMLMGIVFLIR